MPEGRLRGPYLYLSLRAGRRTQMIYVPAERLAEQVRQAVTTSTRNGTRITIVAFSGGMSKVCRKCSRADKN